MADQIGPGSAGVGPGGAETGPGGAFPPSGVIRYSGGTPTSSMADPQALVGPGGGEVGPGGGVVGPGPAYAVIALPPSGTIRLSGAAAEVAPSGVVRLVPPTDDEPPTDASWSRGASNPILEATETWEGTFVREPCVIQERGSLCMWYSAGDPEGIGYATCPIGSDPTDPLSWSKHSSNPIIADGAKPNVFVVDGRHRIFYVDAAGDLRVATTTDGFSAISTGELVLARPSEIGSFGSCAVVRNAWQPGLLARASSNRLLISDGLYNAWPVVCRLNDGRLFKAWTKGNGHHIDNSGAWYGAFSSDDGDTWGTAFLIYDDPTLWTTVMGVSQTSSGRIWVTGWRDSGAPTTAGQGGYVYSDDNGVSFSGWQAVTTSSDLNEYLTGPVVELGNGDLLVPVEITYAADGALHNSSHILRWPNGGSGFTEEIIVRDYATDGIPRYESKLGLLDNGELVIIHRCAANAGLPHQTQRSADNGASWSEPETAFPGFGAPSWIQLSGLNGPLVATTRRDADSSTVAFISFDRGHTWPLEVAVNDTPFEMEYAAPVEKRDGSVLVVFGHQTTTSIAVATIQSTILDIAPWSMLVSGTNALGRWGIYEAGSVDGLAFTLRPDPSPYTTLPLIAGGAVSGPHLRHDDGTFHLWFEATAIAGNLPTDIYHSATADLHADAWSTPAKVFARLGSDFEIDQVARPQILIGRGAVAGIAFLFYDGQNNGSGTGAIGVALSTPVGGITTTIGPGGVVTSDLDLLFDIGAITSEITLPFDIRGPDVTSDITLPFDIRGDVTSDLDLLFDILGPVTSDITLPFDILDTEIIGGTKLRGIPPLWRPLMVFDKGGAYLGSISAGAYNVTNPPVRYLRSKTITNEGGMTFNVPRQSGDMGLIADDRLVRLQSPRGEKPWWGTMSVQPDARGIHEVTNKDPFTLLRDGRGITLKEDVNDGTPATAVMAKLMAIHNDLRALNGEVEWELDLQGSRPFRGDIDFDGDTLACIDIILKRSRTEVAWDSRLEGNRLVPILRMRDRFDAGAGADIFDGPDGNVTAGVQVIEDPTTLVFRLRLRGLTTDLAACLPEWAQWALLDITPEVTVEVDPGPYRMREVRDESVDWGLSKAAIAAQCNAILDWLWGLYRSYLRALHDIEGRPNHEGWAYVGPPDIYEPKSAGKDSLSRRAWRPRLQLVEVRDNEPASAVMISESHSQINLREWLIVRYNRVTGVQNVTVWAIETAKGVELIKWNLTGSATLYQVSGERVIGRSTITTTGAFVDPYNTRVYDPVARRYRELRRIISGPFALAYYVDPADHDNAFVDLGVDAAISTTSGDGSSLISKMYDFERFAIENWDPRRDGIGARLARPTVFFGEPTTRPRWHVVSFDVGGEASTALTHGIGASAPGVANDIEVDSIFGFPDPDLEPDAFPFLVSIDDGMDKEDVLVLSMTGTLWHVLRGQNGTAAIIHEAGAPVKRFGAEAWPGFPFPYTWPEGEQWAAEELAELSKPRIDVNVHVAHFRDDQLTLDYGSMHAVDVATEGAPGRWTGTGRVIGWSTDPGHNPTDDDPTPPGGETELVLEWQQ